MKRNEKLDLILNQLIDSLPFTVMVDESGNIVKLSKNYADYLGVDAEESVGRYITDVIPSSGLPNVLKTKKDTIGDIFVLKNGEKIVVSRYTIMQGNELIGAISTTIFDSLKVVEDLNNQIDVLKFENENYKKRISELSSFKATISNIIGDSDIMKSIKMDLAQMANTDASILITGETGTGKEIFANAVHYLSPRHNNPYVKINCAAIPAELMESELFGYEPGAFSGASKNGKPGKFELADHGTILLDEIGEMSLPLQAKLLRVIQEQEVERVGGTKPIKIDVRILCSTNRNLEEMISQGTFRQDLYYRINVLELKIPPLRERKEDLEALSIALIRENNIHDKLTIEGISNEALLLLSQYDWPGNVRELKHVLERAGIIAGHGIIQPAHLGFFTKKLDANRENHSNASSHQEGNLIEKKSLMERDNIAEAMEKFKGNKKKAAEYLGISRSTLYEKLKQYGLL